MADDVGFTAPESAPGQAESRAGKLRLEALLATMAEPPAWRMIYEDLMRERVDILDAQGKASGRTRARWDWRKALYIAWSCVPREKRWPKFERELAGLLGLSNTSTIRHWREKDPEIDEFIRRLPQQMLLEHVTDVFDALVFVAKTPDPKAFQDRRLFLKMTGNYQPSGSLAVSMTPISYIEVAEDDDE